LSTQAIGLGLGRVDPSGGFVGSAANRGPEIATGIKRNNSSFVSCCNKPVNDRHIFADTKQAGNQELDFQTKRAGKNPALEVAM
jgi:hypothetical protein